MPVQGTRQKSFHWANRDSHNYALGRLSVTVVMAASGSLCHLSHKFHKIVESSLCCTGAGVSQPSERVTGHEYPLLSCLWHEQTIYKASGVKFFLCCHGKGCRNRYQQNISCTCPLLTASLPGAEAVTSHQPTQTWGRRGAPGRCRRVWAATPAAGAGESSNQREQ